MCENVHTRYHSLLSTLISQLIVMTDINLSFCQIVIKSKKLSNLLVTKECIEFEAGILNYRDFVKLSKLGNFQVTNILDSLLKLSERNQFADQRELFYVHDNNNGLSWSSRVYLSDMDIRQHLLETKETMFVVPMKFLPMDKCVINPRFQTRHITWVQMTQRMTIKLLCLRLWDYAINESSGKMLKKRMSSTRWKIYHLEEDLRRLPYRQK
eukprot:GHVP01045724.1.p1 GENE.GHVP01045724.1~~GHVP01045724.1.p1  ORF type:complete len:211 (+),score=18.91 GHVP01045724.1:238-870(+)